MLLLDVPQKSPISIVLINSGKRMLSPLGVGFAVVLVQVIWRYLEVATGRIHTFLFAVSQKELIMIIIGIIATIVIIGIIQGLVGIHISSKEKDKKLYFQEQITKVLALLHYYDSMTDTEGIKRNKYLFMAFHLYLTNIIASPLAKDYDINEILNIVENGMEKDTTLFLATQKLQPTIQQRFDALPSDIRVDFFRKVYIDDKMIVHTETHLKKNLREWYNQTDFHLLKCRQFGNDLL